MRQGVYFQKNSKMKKIIFFIILIVLLVIFALIFDWGREYNFTDLENDSLIVVDYPKEGQKINSPLKISGKAKGSWFFEGSFSIELVDIDRNIISRGIATSTKDWMTEDFIDFTSEIYFDKPTSTTNAIIILKKDNPSGNLEFDQSVFIPVTLK